MAGYYGNKSIVAAWYGNKRLDKMLLGYKVLFDFDELKPKYYYWYGDGYSNTRTRHEGGDYGEQLYYVKGDPLKEGKEPTVVQMPYSGAHGGHGTEGNVGGDPSTFSASQYVYTWSWQGSGGSMTGTSNWNVSSRTDADHEYTLTYSSYTDEGRTDIGPILLTFDGVQTTLQQAINNGCIKPLVPMALYSELGGTTFNIGNLFNGGSTKASQSDDWYYSLGFALQTNKGHHLENIYVGNYKEGIWIKLWDSVYGRITLNNKVYRKSQYTDENGKKRKYW